MGERLRSMLGLLILVVAATAPVQVVYAQRVTTEPPAALAWLLAITPVAATLAAFLAAYFTAQQASETRRQAAEMVRSRLADHLTPKLVETLAVLNDARHYNEIARIWEKFGWERLENEGISAFDLTDEWVRAVSGVETNQRLDELRAVLGLFGETDLTAALESIRYRLPPRDEWYEREGVPEEDREWAEEGRRQIAEDIDAAIELVKERGAALAPFV